MKFVQKFKDNLENVNKTLKKQIINKYERKEMIEMGLNPKKREDVKTYILKKEQEEKEKEEQAQKEREAKEQEERLNNPSEQQLLKEIRDILKNK